MSEANQAYASGWCNVSLGEISEKIGTSTDWSVSIKPNLDKPEPKR
jgi:hypothetical protein